MRPEGMNPCRHVKKYPEHKRERFLSDDEYRRLGAALRDAEREGYASPAGDRRHSPVDADRLPERGNPEPALGVRRSGYGRAAVTQF